MIKSFKKITKILTLCLPFSLFVIFPAHVLADEAKTAGGIEIFQSEDSDFWFKLHGIMKVDGTFFIGDDQDKQNELPSGTNVRAVEATFEGGIGDNLTYTTVLSFESGARVNDAFFTYHGFNNASISIGQVISPFCLENANSGKWIPFLERSLPVIALRPCMGIGANLKTWGNNFTFTIASTTPPHGYNKDSGSIKHRSDRLTTTGRFTFAPIIQDKRVFQVGVSGVYGDTSPTFRDDSPNTDGRRFSTPPEAKARNTKSLVDSGNKLGLKHYTVLGGEIGSLWGPLLMQAEYLQANLNRDDHPNVNFRGWHAQAAYVLTGESREYKPKDASFGRVTPTNCQYGAWEIAARYSTIDLNDKDIQGGKENNTTLALNWYVNKNLKIVGNYIFASILPTQELGMHNPSPNKRHLQIVGLRSQVVW